MLPPDALVIDNDAFEELLGMDDEGDNSFSFNIVQEFLKQGRQTVLSIKENLDSINPNLESVSKLAHFIKGSAATVGAMKVVNTSTLMQYLAVFKDSKTGLKLENYDPVVILEQVKLLFIDLIAGFDEVDKTFFEYYSK